MIITLSGPMGSGKSTAIAEITKQFPNSRLIKFAGTLYDIQEMIYDRISSVYTRPEDFVKDRKLLQWLGTDWGRDTISQTLWVDIWRAEAESCEEAGVVVLCDDCRFDNEASIIKDMGGYIIKLNSDRNLDRAQGGEGIKAHASESGIDSKYVDIAIDNNGTIEEFKHSISNAVHDISAHHIGKLLDR